MKPTVYQFAYSPYCIPVTAVLRAFGVPFRTAEVPVHRRDAIIRLTAGRYYQVPVIVNGRSVVYETGPDTLDVARYIDRQFADGRLFPAPLEGIQRILIPHIENEVESVTFKLADPHRIPRIRDIVERTESIRHKERRFGKGCLDQWRRDSRILFRQAEALLEPFELMLHQSSFLLGDEPVYADFALAGTIGALTFGGHVPFPSRLTALTRWREELRKWTARGTLKATGRKTPPGPTSRRKTSRRKSS
ncbi:glutathione S-transferase [Opitutaceae bacterium TAV5]|nr:glutathione S-transferase [Opitutaceae bacterium TAV5]